MRHFFLLTVALTPLTLFVAPAFAQIDEERFDQLEREVLLLQRKQARSGGDVAAPREGGGGNIGVAQIDVRISAMEEELRALRGKLEEREFENQRLSEELEKFKRDTEFRFSEISPTSLPPGTAPGTLEHKTPHAENNSKKLDMSVKTVPTKPEAPVAAEAAPKPFTEPPAAPEPAAEQMLKPQTSEAKPGLFETPRDHYNYAFRLLNQNQYAEAAKSFAQFTQKYPEDPLVGNAYYWQGETSYIRKDFAGAADQFRQGFEVLPKGPKAADNLLKLGMSLAALKKNEEACIVLSQVSEKFKASAANVAAKAGSEIKRVGCE